MMFSHKLTKIILSVTVLLSVLFTFNITFAQETGALQAPETIEEAQQVGEEILQQLPQETNKVFQEEALPILEKVFSFIKGLWLNTVLPWLQDLWSRAWGVFGQELEERTPGIKDELEKEKQEFREEIETGTVKAGKTLWEKIQELWKSNEQD